MGRAVWRRRHGRVYVRYLCAQSGGNARQRRLQRRWYKHMRPVAK